ncbi:MAG: hypothetical protein WCH83_07495, partial [Alphaproteobacteria bacterium]
VVAALEQGLRGAAQEPTAQVTVGPVVASAVPNLPPAPLPTARPSAIGGSQVASLPALITTGDSRGRTEPTQDTQTPGYALAFAQSTLVPSPSAVVSPVPQVTPTPAPRVVPEPVATAPRPRVARATPPPPLIPPSIEGPRGRAVLARTRTDRAVAQATLSTPDPRQLKLIEAPAQVVAMTFTRTAAAPLTAERFSGSAIVSVRTLDFAPASPQRRAALN